MSSDSKSLGERVGEAASKVKDTLSNTAEFAEHKAKEAGDRSSANAHDAKVEMSNNPLEKAEHRLKSARDNISAEVNEGKTEYHKKLAEDALNKD